MSIDTIEATWKVGRPKWNGVTSANHAASPTSDQSTMPGTNSAATVPRTSPSSIDTRCRAGGAKRSMRTISASVPNAKATLIGGGALGRPVRRSSPPRRA